MPEYTIYFTTTVGTQATVEADNLEDALDAAYDKLPTGVCAQCAGWGGAPGIDMSGDWEADEKDYEVDGKRVTA